MNSQGVSSSSAIAVPPAFCCKASGAIMQDPVLALCGHLFNQSVIGIDFHCPVDKVAIPKNSVIPLSDLKKAIAAWKAFHQEPHKQSQSKVQSIPVHDDRVAQSSSSSSSEVGNVEDGISNLHLGKQDWQTVARKKKDKPIRVVRAHEDDIHGFARLNEQLFVSGSKDGTLKMWDNDGKLSKVLKPDTGRGYEYWVTALTSLSDGYWASGTRDGTVTIWDETGKEYSDFRYNPSQASKETYKSKERNKTRINCITNIPSDRPPYHVYTGTPKYIQRWDIDKGRLLNYYEANQNDWVYCIEIIGDSKLLVVIAANLEVWDTQSSPIHRTSVIQESENERRAPQRPHISAITRLEHNSNVVASALFDGHTKLVDLSTQKLLRSDHEHKGRVWSVINLKPHIYASSADDRTIKIWDIRQQNSFCTLDGNPGRVSALLRLSENTFISGSCPDDVFESENKGSISFWDIRQLT